MIVFDMTKSITNMAKIIVNGKEKEISDGEPIKETCKELGVAFGCESGLCGTCQITILEGNENLDGPHHAEEMMGLEENQRLACQCRIKKGIVKIKTNY